MKNYRPVVLIVVLIILSSLVNEAYSQAEVEPWGNITGIRKHGQLFEFESRITVISNNGSHFVSTGQERQHPHYKRNGDEQDVTTNIDSLFFKESVKDLSRGKAKVTLTLNAHADCTFDGVYFNIILPVENYRDSRLRLLGVKDQLRNFVAAGKRGNKKKTDTNFTNLFELHEFDLHEADEFDLPEIDEWLLDIPLDIRSNKFVLWVFNQLVNQGHKITKIHENSGLFYSCNS